VAAEPDAVDELIELCGRYPLALAINARYAATRPRVPLTELATELRELGLDMLDDDDPAASLPTVLSWSLRGLTDEQRQLFALSGIAPGPDIGLSAAASLTGMSTARTRTALRTLENASLLERHAADRYTMHDLIRTYAAGLARHLPEQMQQAALDRVVDFYLHTAYTAARLLDSHPRPLQLDPPTPGAQPLPLPDAAAAMAWLDAHHLHLLAAQHTAATRHRHQVVWQLAWSMSTYHDRRWHRHDDLAAWRAAVNAAEHLPVPTRIFAHRRLAFAHVTLAQHEAAVDELHRALALAQRHHDPTEQAQTHRYLTMAWEAQGDMHKALMHARHALDLHRALGQPDREADALNAVGWCAAHIGDYDTARTHCQAALALHRQQHNTVGEAHTLDSLGFIDHHSGHHQQAVDYYRQALVLFDKLADTARAADTLDRLGHPHTALNQYEQAHTTWQKAVKLYRQQGRDSEAERVQQQLDNLNTNTNPSPDATVNVARNDR
jgi:tetratricopeptide (TPR) repeat protein